MEKRSAPLHPKPPQEEFVDAVIRPTGVSEAVIEAFQKVDRAEFLPPEVRDKAYQDTVVPLGNLSSVSQPSLVATMIDIMRLNGDEKVLEIGTATGYQASLLSFLSKEVTTIELSPELSTKARDNIERLGYKKITVHTGDGAEGVPGSSFDRIIITAAVKEVPQALTDQLAEGGKIVAPVGNDPGDCILTVFTKIGGEMFTESRTSCMFVPLISNDSAGWSEQEVTDAKSEDIARYRENMRVYLQKQLEGTNITYEVLLQRFKTDLARTLNSQRPLSEDEVLDTLNVAIGTLMSLRQEGED